MAKGKSLLRSGKRKKPNVNRMAQAIADTKFWGEDPPPIKERGAFLTWCANMIDLAQSRKWLDEYLKTTGRSLRGVPDKWINPSVCHRARLKTLGAPFTTTQDDFLEQGIRDTLKHADEAESEVVTSRRPTIQELVREKFHEAMGEVEGMIDDLAEVDITAWYHEKNISPTVAKMIADKLRPRIDEVEELFRGEDEQLIEGYRGYTQDEIIATCEIIGTIIDDTDRYCQNEKKARVTRAPKPVSMEKKLVHIRESYLKHSKEWNITSLDPSKILGANMLWTLNVKYKLLTVFRAESMGGKLDVARCKVAGFDKNNSFTYRLGRGKKAVDIIETVLKSTPSAMKKVVSGLKEAPLQERIGENTILLRV